MLSQLEALFFNPNSKTVEMLYVSLILIYIHMHWMLDYGIIAYWMSIYSK